MRKKHVKINWTDAMLRDLRSMANAGKTSYQIADFLGVSRAAVCGRCSRDKIRLRGGSNQRDLIVSYDKGNPLALSYF